MHSRGRRNSIEPDERDPFESRGGFQGGEHNVRMSQMIFSDADMAMQGQQSLSGRPFDEFESHANMDCFLKGTEYDIFGQVDR